jgi:translation initiation factor IF-3
VFANEQIAGPTVVFIDDQGVNKGEILKRTLIAEARSKGFDLVQVSKGPNGLAICKFGDLGKIKYEMSKRSEAKAVETKEMYFHISTSDHDIGVKKNKIKHMIEKKCRVKFGIELRKRERVFMEKAKEMLKAHVGDFRTIAKWDDLKVSGNMVFVTLFPL